MGTLVELSACYAETAARLRRGIAVLEARSEELDPSARLAAERDLHMMYQMLREAREVGELAAHYYEPAYWRSGKYTC